jgi:hypothetical protein
MTKAIITATREADGAWPVRLLFDSDHFGSRNGMIELGAGGQGPLLTKEEAELLIASLQEALVPANPHAYADVTLLDGATGTAPDRVGTTSGPWTYSNPDGYTPGTYVFVPFGPYSRLYLAKIVATSPEPSYTGSCRIKEIDGKAVSV